MKRKLLAFGMAGILLLVVASISVAEPEFSVTGHFRALSYWITNPDLDKDVGNERSYTEQRLILNPSLKISDWVTLNTRIRALDYIWGDNTVPGLTWPGMIDRAGNATNQGDAGTNNFQWDRAWVHLFFGKYGSLQIGRQKTDLFLNFSIAEDDTYPRYHYITPVFDLGNDRAIMFGILYGKRGEGDLDVAGDDALTWCPWAFFMSPKLTIGYVFFVWDIYGAAEDGKNVNWIMHDAMINAKIGPVDIKSEWDYIMGDALPFADPLAPGGGPLAVSGTGDDIKHSLEFFVDASVPVEASPFISKVAVVVGLFSGVKDITAGEVTGSIGSNEDWIDDWKIDIILWDQLYNAIHNAWIIRPKIDFVVPDTKWGGYLSACMSFADQKAEYNSGPLPLTTGDEKGIGTEIDLAINYTLGPAQTIELVLGYFAPGKYFAEANRDGTIGAVLKTHIRF